MHVHCFCGGVGDPGGPRIIGNHWFSMHFHCVGSGVGGRGRPLVHKKITISMHLRGFGVGVGGLESLKIYGFPYIFILWARGMEARAAPDSLKIKGFDAFASFRPWGGRPTNH